ncbi:MAG TPA: 50S ribosomal protein L15 [Actinomycetota bacterium]
MKLHHLKPPKGAKKDRTRVGRGRAGARGKTAGRGTKGYLARNQPKQGFEGGQMPLARRVPKKKGFTNRNREAWAVVNVETLAARFEAGETVTPETMAERGLVRRRLPVKVLGAGEIDRALTIQAHAVSKGAREKIEGAGGTVEVL